MSVRPAIVHALFAISAMSIGSGCERESAVQMFVFAPDDADPFNSPDGATHVRVTIEDDASGPRVSEVAANGEFTFQVQPAEGSRGRVKIEALKNDQVIASGATPPVAWRGTAGQRVGVLMHYNDTTVPAPFNFTTPRRDFALLNWPDNATVVALTVGDAREHFPDFYNTLSHASGAYTQYMEAWCDGETAVLPVAIGLFMHRAANTLYWTGDSRDAHARADTPIPPIPRRALYGEAVVVDTRNVNRGGWLVGGRSGPQVLSPRVDRVGTDLAWQEPPPPPMRIPRAHAEIVELRAPIATITAQWLIASGQHANPGDEVISQPLFETYNPGAVDGRIMLVGDESIDHRTDVSMLCIARDVDGCASILVLGGRVGTTRVPVAAEEDFVIDGACARVQPEPSCALIRSRGPWLTRRRWGARVAIAEGGRVVVAGGSNADGPVFEVETINIEDPAQPVPGSVVATLPVADPAVLALPNGSVMLAGGTGAEGQGVQNIWFYRH